jgi:hypothetical protein
MDGVDDFVAGFPEGEGAFLTLQHVGTEGSALMVYDREFWLARILPQRLHMFIMNAVRGCRTNQEVDHFINHELVPEANERVLALNKVEDRFIAGKERQQAVDVTENDCRVELKIFGHVTP